MKLRTMEKDRKTKRKAEASKMKVISGKIRLRPQTKTKEGVCAVGAKKVSVIMLRQRKMRLF